MMLTLDKVLDIFKALQDRTRFRIFWILHRAKCAMCVCELEAVLKESQYNISRHLKVLKLTGLVKERKQGKFVYYAISKLDNKAYRCLLDMVSAISDNKLKKDAQALFCYLKQLKIMGGNK
ncbi:MAG: metalloregulator ArsR/SmtB family transcription factor [candidate division WOR-3 bacterium]|nr:metalloregulator ArsR/SmtB family transcription factor [candidate division WOR-3 bacterium]MCX7756895.1 metalloregulator ArsR/SmtB family transcription factor [candidate division WOR-3 bacterium]MDW7987381.1 metalloregulator ArsR/SmtB family transcription factor [candidate division WOR-3 bacterium]